MKQKLLVVLTGFVASSALLVSSGNAFASPQADQLTPATARIAVQKSDDGDTAYQRGSIVSIYVSALGSDNYGKYRGTLTLDFLGTGAMDYKWGGSTCPGRDLSGEQVQMLVMARAHDLKVTPEHKRGQGGALCLTGFTLSG
ncbi:hypothetical protein FF098_003055 [Parvularcula flava]|uniref:Uncharacterized protein n=1 Tax=Aquisalinus luteolus TaxID=1566827 RepID=A0A8J3EQE9_9PROT|nr:hypothetical protein [Aquisalinus luteolus]NHK26885.1 hypothetical protein [Aquisalinus luteolus]GGH93710.1 hypothetical protein GCM10011355_06190 [Aquisalinus luteolus]